MMSRTILMAVCVFLGSSSIGWSAGKLTTYQIETCGEDAVKLCPASDSIEKSRMCLIRRIKEVAPSCAYLLKRANIR